MARPRLLHLRTDQFLPVPENLDVDEDEDS